MTLHLVADENFDGDLYRGVLRRAPLLDLVRVQDVSLAGVADPDILEWAARGGRVLVTHDVNTVPAFAYQRVRAGLPLAGVILVPTRMPLGQAIDEVVLLAETLYTADVNDRVIFLPL